MKRIIIGAFLLLLFGPLALSSASFVTGDRYDISLSGYTDETQKPKLSFDSFFSGDFQSNYAAWYQENFQPRGVFIKSYSTLRYNLFDLNDVVVVGKNKDLMSTDYIFPELCISGAPDYSNSDVQEQAAQYIDKLKLLQQELSRCGKTLYVVMTPNKADFHKENIPSKYVSMSDPAAVSVQDYVAELLKSSGIPHLICPEMKDSLQYPAFYTTGLHWSRTFEQEALAIMLNDLREYTGKNYPSIVLGEVESQDKPFWRDADLLQLANVWDDPTETYYQYSIQGQYPEQFDELGIIFQGTSFSHGFFFDYSDALPLENVTYVCRNIYIQTADGTVPITSFETVDFAKMLDQTDVVVIEILPPEFSSFGYGFVEALLETLEDYAPASSMYMNSFDVHASGDWKTDGLKGVYDRDAEFAWTQPQCQVTICDPQIAQEGIELNFGIPAQLLQVAQDVNLRVYVNGTQVQNLNFTDPWSGSIFLTPEMLAPTEDGVYAIRLICDASFQPSQVDPANPDNRELSLALAYIGRMR